MSIGGSNNLGTLLIRRLDTALSVQASQQSQIVNAAKADAIAQLADAARLSPVHNEGGRPLPETIEKAQAQVERQARQTTESGRLQQSQPGLRMARPTVDTATTPSAPTRLGHAARTILALLSLFPDQAPPLRGRQPLIPSAPSGAAPAGSAGSAGATAGGAQAGAQAGATTAGTPTPAGPATGAASLAGAGATGGQPAQILHALSLALQQSGAFYESHLQDMASGGRSMAQLKQEPQGRINLNASSSPTSTPAQTAAPEGAARPAASVAEGAAADGRGQAATTAQSSAAASQTLTGTHPDTQPIVRQQLEILAGQVFTWRGEAWPDTSMEWEIARQDEEGLPDEAGAHWATSLRLSLPTLGQVEARLSLHGKQVVMRLVAPQSASTLVENDLALRAGFQDAGLTLSQLTILEAENQ